MLRWAACPRPQLSALLATEYILWCFWRKIVLSNEFHRVYALRALGIEKIPAFVQQVANPQLEFPEQISGLMRVMDKAVHQAALECAGKKLVELGRGAGKDAL